MKIILFTIKIEHLSLCGEGCSINLFFFKYYLITFSTTLFVAFPSSNKQNLL